MFYQSLKKIYSMFSLKTKKLKIPKLLIILIIGFGVLLYIIDLSSLRLLPLKFPLSYTENEEDRPWDWTFMENMNQEDQILYQSYFIYTEGCRMPSFKVIDENVRKYLFEVKPVQCGKPLIRSNNNYMWIDLNETEIKDTYGIEYIEELKCEYLPFRRKTDFENEYPNASQKVSFRFSDVVRVPEEFIRVVCRVDGREKNIYEDYHFFVKNKQINENSIKQNRISNTDTGNAVNSENDKSNEPMNVMVIGIDSVSRLNFHRRMNETANVLLNDLGAIEMFGFNKFADNTYPNLIPTLTGLDANELVYACMPQKNDTYDRCNFIWNTFKAKSFTTAFVEDMASLGLFQFLKNGFKKQPTDYSIRPILIEMERHIAKQKVTNAFYCLGKRRTFDVFLEYIQKFLAFMSDRLHFSFFWTASFTHDYLNMPMLIDNDLAEFLRELQTSGTLDNLFLVLMSDHGIRWGSFRATYQGMMEERQPFLFFIPPKRFIERYPEAMRNLVRNRRRLVTHFDLYETLRDLTDLKTLKSQAIKKRVQELNEMDPMPRGISTFLPIPLSRSCFNAEIAPHWCTCHERTELPTTDVRVSEVARIIVDRINEMIKPYPQCQKLRLNAVFTANLGMSNTISFRNVSNHFVDATVHLDTRPGLGKFEATVRIYENNNYELTGTISRTNMYKKQSYCINDYILKLYCFCDRI